MTPARIQTITVIVPVPVSPEVLSQDVVRSGKEGFEEEGLLDVVSYFSERDGQGDVVVSDQRNVEVTRGVWRLTLLRHNHDTIIRGVRI